jgi:VIT1/CCC1 family predicted Fe2+/Mn2+ transporter
MSNDANQEILLGIGELKGKMDMVLAELQQHHEAATALDTRVRKVENTAAKVGAVSAGVVSIGLAFIKAKMGLGEG